MVSRRLLSISVCLLAAVRGAAAQEKNHAIRIERESIAAADARVVGARGDYDPQLHFDVTTRRWRDPNTSLFSGAPSGEVAATNNVFGSSLSISQLFKSGGTASLWTSVSREGTNNVLTLFQPA